MPLTDDQRNVPVTRADYYPEEDPGAWGDMVHLPVRRLSVDANTVEEGRVTLGAGLEDPGESAYGFEFDVEPDSARTLARLLCEAADRCSS